jgi:hypothetical protein
LNDVGTGTGTGTAIGILIDIAIGMIVGIKQCSGSEALKCSIEHNNTNTIISPPSKKCIIKEGKFIVIMVCSRDESIGTGFGLMLGEKEAEFFRDISEYGPEYDGLERWNAERSVGSIHVRCRSLSISIVVNTIASIYGLVLTLIACWRLRILPSIIISD